MGATIIEAQVEGTGSSGGARRPGRRSGAALLVVSLVALVAAVLLPVAPVRMSTPVVSWPQQPAHPVSTMLELTSQRPVDLRATFGCATARAAGSTVDGVVLSTIRPDASQAATDGLRIRSLGGRLLVDGVGATIASDPVPAGSCTYTVHADAAGVAVSRDGTVVGRGPDGVLPQVDVLATSLQTLSPAAGEGLQVRVAVDDQFATSPAPTKVLLVVIALLGAVAALVLLARADRSPGTAPVEGRSRPRLPLAGVRAAVDAVVVLLTVLWAFLTPMTGDDGYYAAMAKNAPLEGYVGQYYQLLNQSFTPFTWFYRLLGWWAQVAGDSPLMLRMPALVAGLLTYLIASRLVASALRWRSAGDDEGARSDAPRRRTAGLRAVAVAVVPGLAFLAWWLPQDMGMRPEAMVALGAVGCAAAVWAAVRRASLFWAGIAVLVGGVGFVCHPTGFVALAPLVAGLPRLVRLFPGGGPLRVAGRVLGVLAPGAIAAVVAFGDGTLHDFTHGQQIFLSIQQQDDWTDEYQRYALLLGPGFMGAYAKRLPVLVALVAVLLWLVLAAALRSRGRVVPPLLNLSGGTLLLAFLALWLTPSKWTFHFGSLAGLGTVFLSLFLLQVPGLLRVRERRIPGWVLLAGALPLVLAVALSFKGPNSWPSSWMLGVPHADVPPFVSGITLGSPLLWLVVALAVGAVLVVRARRRGERGGAAVTAVVPGAVALLLALALFVSDGYLLGSFSYGAWRTRDTWSPWADTIADPLAKNCHAAHAFSVLDDATARPLAAAPVPAGADSQAAAPSPFREGSGYYVAQPPASTAGPVWGSLQPPALEKATGTSTSPWWTLPAVDPARQRVALTAAGHLGGGNSLVAEYGRPGPGGVEVVGRQDLDDGQDLPYWRTRLLDPGVVTGAAPTVVRLVATDGTTDVGGWLAYSQPSLQDVVSTQRYLGGPEPVAVAWQIALLFPCQQQPRVEHGITEPSQYGILYGTDPTAQFGDATWLARRGALFAPVLREASVTGLPTVLPSAPQVDDVQVYRFQYPYATGAYDLAPGTTTLMGWAQPPGWDDRQPW